MPHLIFLNFCFFILFCLNVYFLLLLQTDFSPSYLPVTVGSLHIFLYFTFHSLHIFLYIATILNHFCGLSHSPAVPSSLSACKCGTASHCLTCPVLQLPLCHTSSPRVQYFGYQHPGCSSPPLLPVWMNVSSLTPWLSDFYTVQFSGSIGCFLFLNLLLSFFWLCDEAKCIYLCLHLDWQSNYLSFLNASFMMGYIFISAVFGIYF